jgi:hypothetical protein
MFNKKFKDKLLCQIKKKSQQMMYKNNLQIHQDKNVQLDKMIGLIIAKKKKKQRKIILEQLINLQDK